MKKIIICFCLSLIGFSLLSAQIMNKEEALQKGQEILTFLQESRGQEVYDRMDAKSQSAINEVQLNSLWVSLIMQLGTYQEARSWNYSQMDNYDVVTAVVVFEKLSLEYKVVFDQDKKISGMWFNPLPPEVSQQIKPESDESFYEKEITVSTGKYNLPGFLTLPYVSDKSPCVILVHGSGAHDRDETIMGNCFFKDVAHGLAKAGIASLRYDKRTYVYKKDSVDDPEKITFQEEVIDDVLSAIELAMTEDLINSQQVFVLGHSLGAMLAPEIATQSARLKGIIMMAGNASPLEKVIIDQLIYINSLEENSTVAELLEKTRNQVANMSHIGTSSYVEEIGLPFDMGYEYAKRLLAYDQLGVAERLELPVLLMNGEKDYQVSIAEFNKD